MKNITTCTIFIPIFFLTLYSCAQVRTKIIDIKVTDSTLKDSKHFISLTLQDWDISFVGRGYDEDNTLTARITKADGDTIKNLIVFLDDEMRSSGIVEYRKEFSIGKNRHHLLFDKKDTLYHYYLPLNNENSPKTFIVGEYYFKSFTHKAMTFEERAFFRKHRDSLIRIKGTNLPKLPKN